jgi:HD-GYP domain-containing protein (c-di-GMP phosphodiesterase class II)
VWVSIVATCVVILAPTGVVSLAVRLTSWTPNTATMWVTTGSLSALLLVGGTQWWMRQPGSVAMSFGELMLWRWLRRRHADEVLNEGNRLLEPSEMLTRNGQLEMLRELNDALEVRDPYTRGHSRRVERHAYRTALAMHRSVEDIFNLRVAASLHDIGKIRVPIEIIRKQGPLDEKEWEIMKSHPAAGAQMISNIGHEALVRAVRHHHERWDGKGYPDGISGEDIPLHARIISVCDTFDAITSTRSYRSKSSRADAIAIIKKNSGTQFDPAVVDAFLSAMPRGVPGVAALSALTVPAVKKGMSQLALLLREAGLAGVAGAIATSGVAGAVTTSVVNPGKYLDRQAIVRSQGDEHASDRARERANEHSAIVLDPSSEGAGPKQSGPAAKYSPRSDRVAERRLERNAAPGRSERKESTPGGQQADGAGTTGKSTEHRTTNNGKAKENDPVVASSNDKGQAATDKVRETVEKPVDEVQGAVEDTTNDLPPGQEKKEGPATDDDDSILESTVEGGSTESKGNGKPK